MAGQSVQTAHLAQNWRSSSFIALQPINASVEDAGGIRHEKGFPFSAPMPVVFLPAWKDEINQASFSFDYKNKHPPHFVFTLAYLKWQVYTPSSKALPYDSDSSKNFPEYFPKAPALSEKTFLMKSSQLTSSPSRSMKTTAYRESFLKPEHQGIQENQAAFSDKKVRTDQTMFNEFEADDAIDRFRTR
jgi:hypothetical protein